MTPENLAALVIAGQSALREVTGPMGVWTKFAEGTTRKIERQATLHGLIDAAKLRLRGISNLLVDQYRRGIAGVRSWFREMFATLAASHVAAAMASLGIIEPEDEDIELANERAEDERDRYLVPFRKAIVAGSVLLLAANPTGKAIPVAQRLPSLAFLRRAELYGDALWPTAEAVLRQRMGRLGYDEEGRVTGAAERHCEACPGLSLAAVGWQPIGTLPAIGDTPCGSRCRCHFVYRRSTVGRVLTPLVAPGGPVKPTGQVGPKKLGIVPGLILGGILAIEDRKDKKSK